MKPMDKRRMFFTLMHSVSVGVLVGTESWGLAAFVFCLFIDRTVSE